MQKRGDTWDLSWGGAYSLILLDHMDFQMIKINSFHKVILGKAGLAVAFEFRYGSVKPDGLSQVKFIADIIQRLENLMSACITAVIADDSIFY